MATSATNSEWERVAVPADLPEDGATSYIPESRLIPSVNLGGAQGDQSIDEVFENQPLSVWSVATPTANFEETEGETPEETKNRPIQTVAAAQVEERESDPLPDLSGFDTLPSNPALPEGSPAPAPAPAPPPSPDFSGGGTESEGDSPFHDSPTIEIKAPQYFLHKKIGEGGCGEVWQARQTSLGRLVAVKKLKKKKKKKEGEAGDSKPSPTEKIKPSPAYIFRQEAMTTALLEHPNIIPVHDLGEDQNGDPLLAMKLVRGEPWDRLLRNDLRKMEPEALLAKHLPILVDVSQAVAFAHSMGVIHRDLKPGQVMIGEFGETLLMDWGLSLLVPPEARPDADKGLDSSDHFDCDWANLPTRATASNPAGTPFFMAPEQTRPEASDIGMWTDIYLLGGTLYYILSGHYPHESVSAIAALKKAAKGDIARPEATAPGRYIPEELANLAMEALAKDPNDRLPSAKAFIGELEDFISGASNRRKSQQLSEEVERILYKSKGTLSYRRVAVLLGQIAQALKLWPGNFLAEALNDRLHADYAEAAIEEGDLKLAQVQIDIVKESEEREELQTKLDIATKKRRTQARQRRVLGFGSFFFLVCIVVGSLWFAKTQNQLNYDMNERMKELAGIFNLSDIIREEIPLEEKFAKAVEVIPPAWQYPDITTARLTVDDSVHESDNFMEGPWSQVADIVVEDEVRGQLEVFYTEKRPFEDEGPFSKEERKLLDRMAALIAGAIVNDAAEKEQARILYDMSGRAKMLNCIYGVTDAIDRYDEPKDIFGAVVRLIPSSWQYPEATAVRIHYIGEEYTSSNFKETEWLLSAPIMAGDEEIGSIDVVYLSEKPEVGEGPFLFEERDLIDRIAILLGEALNNDPK